MAVKTPKPTEAKSGINAIEMISIIKQFLHTFIRFLPLSMYSFTYLSIALYKDLRSAVLLLGLVLNDIVGLLYNKYSKPKIPATCAIFKKPKAVDTIEKKDDLKKLGILPNPHTEIMGFITSFFFSDMYNKGKFDVIPGWFLVTLTIITSWSRMELQCKTFNDVLFNLLRGALLGMLFYYFFKDYYKSAEKGVFEKETCDLGYKNYKCDVIQDGTVIVKNMNDQEKHRDKGGDDDEKDNMDDYYD